MSKNFTKEEKIKIIKKFKNRRTICYEFLKEYKIDKTTIYWWMRKSKKYGEFGLVLGNCKQAKINNKCLKVSIINSNKNKYLAMLKKEKTNWHYFRL